MLPGEHPLVVPSLAAGTYPAWSAAATYKAGALVLYQGRGYRAKWYTAGDVPGAQVSDPAAAVWAPITN